MLPDPTIRETLPVNRTRTLTVQINKRLLAYGSGSLVPASKNRCGGFFLFSERSGPA
jgi:hypothetical protein